MNRRRIAKKLLILRKQITTILNEEDPIGLIQLGAPSDEYDPEVGTILPRLEEATSASVLRRILHEEFSRWFGSANAGAEHAYTRVSERIWGVLCDFRDERARWKDE